MLWDEMIKPSEEEAKQSVHNFSSDIGSISVLQGCVSIGS